jgi:transcriptional regulator with XRE-family HTH domain
MCDVVDVTVGRRLKARRRLLGITQKGLAAYCGVTFQQIQKYECAVSRISATTLWKLACVLDVDVSYFFSGITRGEPVSYEPAILNQTSASRTLELTGP